MKTRVPHDGVYARIGLSKVHGVGAIAIREIPKGALIFRHEIERVTWVSRAWVRRLPIETRRLYEDFGMLDGEKIGVPPNLNNLSVGWYLNHSERPNTEAGDDGRFRALRRIRKDEELTADYRTFSEDELEFRPLGARRARRSGTRRARG